MKTMKNRIVNTLLLATLFELFMAAPWVLARRATPEDAPYQLLKRNISIRVHSDGTFDWEGEELIEILKEGKKEEVGTRRFPYSPKVATLKVLRAEVINGDERREVDSRFIEDKSLSSPEQGFDDKNQLVVAYPDVRLGSKLYLKYRLEVNQVPYSGHFSERFEFGAGMLTQEGKITIRSDLPLSLEVNDPNVSLDISQVKSSGLQETQIRLKKPVYLEAVNERSPYLPLKSQTWVLASSTQDYAQLVKIVGDAYETIVRAPLPPGYEKIFQSAKELKTSVEQINSVTSQLAELVRYNGDWRPVKGGIIPRELTVVESTRFGDCKDFAAATSAILRKLGYEAFVAWVQRDRTPDPFPKLAFSGVFNHAIVWAKKEGKVFWVDPTNLQSFAQGLFDDISGRSAIIVDIAHPRIEQIPEPAPDQKIQEEVRKIQPLRNGTNRIQSMFRLKGGAAVEYTGVGLKWSQDMLEHAWAMFFTRENDLISYKAKVPDLTTRIVKDMEIGFDLLEKRNAQTTTAGQIFVIPGLEFAPELATLETKERISGFVLGSVFRIRKEYELKQISLVGQTPKDCEIDSPWFNLTRKFRKVPGGIRISDDLENRVRVLSKEDLESPKFEKLQLQLRACFDLMAVIYRLNASSHQ